MKKWIAGCIVLALMTGGMATVKAEDLAIKDVMKKAHQPPEKGKPTLLAKVTSGKASDDEKKELVELYEALGKNKPPKGDEDEWKTRTAALLKAAKSAAEGGKGAAKELGKASNCAACHKAHRA
jgi:hypothetical protein